MAESKKTYREEAVDQLLTDMEAPESYEAWRARQGRRVAPGPTGAAWQGPPPLEPSELDVAELGAAERQWSRDARKERYGVTDAQLDARDAAYRARRVAAQRAMERDAGKPVRYAYNPDREYAREDALDAMGAANRLRYYLGLPQGATIRPGMIPKALQRLEESLGYDPATEGGFKRWPRGLEEKLWDDLHKLSDDTFEWSEPPAPEALVTKWGPEEDPAAAGYKYRELSPASGLVRYPGESHEAMRRRLKAQYAEHTEEAIDQDRYGGMFDALMGWQD